MKLFAITAFSLLIAISPISGQTAESIWASGDDEIRFSFYLGIQDFYWDEHDAGEKILDENGYLLELGMQYDNLNRASEGGVYQFKGGMNFGQVKYDGQTQSGTPVKTDVNYGVFYLEGSGGYRFETGESSSVDLMAGLGLNGWSRDLENSITATGTPVYGYQEDYSMWFWRLMAGFNFSTEGWFHHLHGGIKRPFFVEQRVEAFDLDLEPEPKNALFVEWRSDFSFNYGKPRYGIAIYYEETRFDKSQESAGISGGTPIIAYQPESNRIEQGIRFHWYF